MTPPDLTVESGPIIVFTDNEDWRNSITGITYFYVEPGVEEFSVDAALYTISEGEIFIPEPDPWIEEVIDFDSLPEGWDSEGFPVAFFVVYADGYEDGLAIWQFGMPL